MVEQTFSRLFAQIAETLDRRFRWHRMPTLLGLLILIGLRERLRERNLYDTPSPSPTREPAPEGGRHLTARTADGTFNDLEYPLMGSAGTPFGRNVPPEHAHPEPEPAIRTPNPRTVSRELLTRHEFQPVEGLNLLAAAWLQFMIRDWLSHGKGTMQDSWELEIEGDDDWPQDKVRVPRTPRTPGSGGGAPPAYLNNETHWWDASQIYGSSKAFQDTVRSGEGGKLRVGPDLLNPAGPNFQKHPADEPGFWVGLAMLHVLFTLEHNAICDRLRAEYPSWSDDDLFDHARLVNAALLAKIHTVEWTTAILGHPTMRLAMRGNWWGIAGERIGNLLGRISTSEVISGIPGSPKDHYGVPYSITEEFVAVYRMHPLIPDDFDLRSASDDATLQRRAFPGVANRRALEVMEQVSMADLLYSLGTMHPGKITLHNYPRALQRFERPDGELMDLAATDVMRTRELGVPRYNKFRELLRLPRAETFEELTDDPVWAEELRRVYGDVDRVDLMVGMYAERFPEGFGFSETAFRIFVLMASRRLNSDRFFTTDYTARVYTQTGLDWISSNDMSTVLLRHFPNLLPSLRNVKNAFAPWQRAGT